MVRRIPQFNGLACYFAEKYFCETDDQGFVLPKTELSRVCGGHVPTVPFKFFNMLHALRVVRFTP